MMLNLDYDFDRKKKTDTFWVRFGRPALLFTVIGAVTAGGIWLLVPKSEIPAEKPPVPPPAESAPLQQESQEPWSSTNPDSGTAETKLPEKTQAAVEAGQETASPPEDSPAPDEPIPEPADTPSAPAAPKTEKEAPPAENISYDKGKVIPGDLPAEQDHPELTPEPQNSGHDAQFAEIEKNLQEKAWEKAAAGAATLLASCAPDSAAYLRAGKLLGKARWEQLGSGKAVDSWSHDYHIRSGDALLKIALREKTSVEQLKFSSRLRGDTILVGRKLVVWPGPWSIEVVKEPRLLKLYNHAGGKARLFAVYDVGIGRLNRTPAAEFVISFKEKHPAWYAPDGRIFKYGEKGNVLGDYFLKLAPVQNPGKPLRGYGIHGTDDESSVGRSLSNGCIRMRNADAAQLYTIVPARTPVRIMEKSPSATGEKR